MKKTGILFVMVFFALALASCGIMFSGNRTGNENQLIMDYTVLNKTDVQLLELEEGDVVDFDVVSEKGKLDIALQKEKEEPVYEGKDIPTNSFEVEITDAGTYKCSVTGTNARGSVSIIKR